MASTEQGTKMTKPTKLLIISQLLSFFFEIWTMLQSGYLDLKLQFLLYVASYIFLAVNISRNNRGKELLFSTCAVFLLFILNFELNTSSGTFPFLQSLTTLIIMLGLVILSLKHVGVTLLTKLEPLLLRIYKISFWVNLILTLSLSLEDFGYYNYPSLLLMSLGITVLTRIAVYKSALWIANGVPRVKTKERRDAYVFDIEPMDMKER